MFTSVKLEVTENIKKIGDKYGKIDTLVNNAGGLGGRSRFEEMTTEFYRKVMAIDPLVLRNLKLEVSEKLPQG